MRSDCRPTASFRRRACACALTAMLIVFGAGLSAAQNQPPHEPAAAETHATETHQAEAEGPHEQTLAQTIAKLANFALLAGFLVYFLKTPIATYLTTRSTAIRQDLITASEMRSAAGAQLAEIETRLKMLPSELDALKRQGEQDVAAERQRIAAAAAAERGRLIAQAHREIETRLRVARRELTEHAANLAVQIAERRIKGSITADDQLRLLDRYASQLKEAR